MTDLKGKTINGIKWSAVERVVTQAIQLIVMLILGRLLGPEAFGLVGMLAIFIAISQTFVDSGFGNALIRKQDRNEADYATTFYFNIGISIVCYIILYLTSPLVSTFYQEPELTTLLRVLGLTILLNACTVVQRARLAIEMDFKVLAKVALFSVSISAITALILAYCNYGVWALVYQTLIYTLTSTVLINIYSPWQPTCGFSRESFRNLFGFGSKLLVSALINTIYNNIYQLIIGKQFSSSQLGFFSQAKSLSSTPAMTLTGIIQRVTYPMLSQLQDDKNRLESAYLLVLKLSSAVIFPMMIGIAAISKPFILLILGEEWLNTANLISILCFGFMLYPIHAINLNLLQVKGRSDLFLKIEIIKKLMVTVILCITVPLGIEAICIGMTIQSYLALIVNTHYTGKLTSLSLTKQLKSLIPFWFISVVIGVVAFFVSTLISAQIIKIAYILVFSIVVYVLYLVNFYPNLITHCRELIKK